MHQIKKLLFPTFSAIIIIGCLKPINSPVGSWKGKAITGINSEGKKMKKTSNYHYTLHQGGSCTIIVKTIWDIDGLETKDEFEGSWHQESNRVTVQYNLLDEKKVADYATTPRNWNEVRHVFTIDSKLMNMNGNLESTEITLVRESIENF
ncbi:MAG: hypothetical protein VYC62_02085 [Verrucomicrobiota bacterium]|nr:hypothetical protein [Verrucomicrobiota bacterium]